MNFKYKFVSIKYWYLGILRIEYLKDGERWTREYYFKKIPKTIGEAYWQRPISGLGTIEYKHPIIRYEIWSKGSNYPKTKYIYLDFRELRCLPSRLAYKWFRVKLKFNYYMYCMRN